MICAANHEVTRYNLVRLLFVLWFYIVMRCSSLWLFVAVSRDVTYPQVWQAGVVAKSRGEMSRVESGQLSPEGEVSVEGMRGGQLLTPAHYHGTRPGSLWATAQSSGHQVKQTVLLRS